MASARGTSQALEIWTSSYAATRATVSLCCTARISQRCCRPVRSKRDQKSVIGAGPAAELAAIWARGIRWAAASEMPHVAGPLTSTSHAVVLEGTPTNKKSSGWMSHVDGERCRTRAMLTLDTMRCHGFHGMKRSRETVTSRIFQNMNPYYTQKAVRLFPTCAR